MAKPMRGYRHINPGPFRGSPYDAPSLGGMQVALPFTADEHRGIGISLIPNRNHFNPGIGGQEYGAGFAALAEHGDLPGLTPGLHVPPFQTTDLADPAPRFCISGDVPPEIWNRLGTKVLPKLRSGSDLKIGIEFSVTVDGQLAGNFKNDLMQILEDLSLTGRVQIE